MQPGLPEWMVVQKKLVPLTAKSISINMVSRFFATMAPPHKSSSNLEGKEVVVVVTFFFVVKLYGYNALPSYDSKQSRYKCCPMPHSFCDFNYIPSLLHHDNVITLSFPTKYKLTSISKPNFCLLNLILLDHKILLEPQAQNCLLSPH